MKKETKLSISQVFVYLVLLFVFVFFSVLTKTFLSTKNLLNICRQVSMTGICAVGMTMVLLTGGIDLSLGPALSAFHRLDYCAFRRCLRKAHQ